MIELRNQDLTSRAARSSGQQCKSIMAKQNKQQSFFPPAGDRKGYQITEAFTFPMQLAAGEKNLEADITIDTKGSAPTGSFKVKCKSGSITNEADDRQEFLDAWNEAGEQMYDMAFNRLTAEVQYKSAAVGQKTTDQVKDPQLAAVA